MHRLFACVLFGPFLLTLSCPGPAAPPPPPRHPTHLPPQAPVVEEQCDEAAYLRGGRYRWRQGRWHWESPVCAPRPPHWRSGCVWERGHWARDARRLIYREGRLRCPAETTSRPSQLPPAPPSGSIVCGAKRFHQVGRYIWRDGAWLWRSGRCVLKPSHWRRGCTWERGRWVREKNALRFVPGRLNCPAVKSRP